LVVAIAEAVGDEPFAASEVFTHARLVSPALAAALRATDITSVVELGKWLQRMQGVTVAGLSCAGGRSTVDHGSSSRHKRCTQFGQELSNPACRPVSILI
jgi:hypothetical protein